MGKASRRKRERRVLDTTESLDSAEPVIYRYLEEEGHVTAWTSGGRIPLRQALFYRNLEGEGGRADTEDSMHRTVEGMRLSQIQNPGPGPSHVRIGPGANIESLVFKDCTFSGPLGIHYVKDGKLSQHHPPSLVLCFSTTLSAKTAKAVDAKCKYCVRILDIKRLRQIIDDQLGAKGEGRIVQYTTGDDRNTFLKSMTYCGQAEYRLAWEGLPNETVWVELPVGIAERVEIPGQMV